MSEVTRFAPSPTGLLHVGGVRTALFAWLVAKQTDGKFILRLEDTDQAREVSGADQHIMDSLQWLGLQWDEGPFRQSDRLAIYKEWADKLIEAGRAYTDPYTQSELDELREKAKVEKKPFLFRNHRPENPPKWDGKQPLRFLSDPKVYKWDDAVMGKMSSGPEAIDDFILIKSDGYPTYNFAHIVDDYLMGVTYVIRSQEFVSSIPRFLDLYEALKITRPILATLPVVLGPDGKKKLSKRDGAKDILDYAKDGYLPDAMFNFLVTLGWNDGTTQEIYTRDEILKKFDMARVQRSGAKFDEQRLTWMNGHYIRNLSIEKLFKLSKDYWPSEASKFDDDYKKAVLSLVQERLKFLAEIPELTKLFFTDLPVDKSLIKTNKKLADIEQATLSGLLKSSRGALSDSDFSVEDLSNRLNQLLTDTYQSPAILFSLIRIATTWAPASPGLAESLHVLGKETTLRRLDRSIEQF